MESVFVCVERRGGRERESVCLFVEGRGISRREGESL